MLISGDSCGQDVGGHGIENGGEAVGDSPCSGSPLEVIHGAQGEGKGEAAELVIQEYLAEIAGGNTAKADGSTGSVAQGVNCRLGIGAEGYGEGGVAQLHPLLKELVDDGATVGHGGEENELTLGLKLAHDLYRYLIALCRADNSGETGHATIDHLNPPRARLDIADGAVEGEAITHLWLFPLNELYPFDNFLGKQGDHSGICGLT